MKDVAEYLLEKGAYLEAVTNNGGTPIMRAIESSKPDLVQFLIQKGAKLQVENAKGTSLGSTFEEAFSPYLMVKQVEIYKCITGGGIQRYSRWRYLMV